MQQSLSLNPEQQIAVEHTEGPMLVLAGAGSGKTRIVTHRILHLLEIGTPASEILAVTFTNKAAEEMRQRIMQMAKLQILTCTFHSLCAKILRESIQYLGYTNHFIILDEEDSEKALKECLAKCGIKDEKSLLKSIRAQIQQAKNSLQEPECFCKENPTFFEIYSSYEKKLKEYNALDFDDLLFLTVKLFQTHPDVLEKYQMRWSFILIDEYQDTNAAQYNLTRLLSERHRNVFAVGDPDQSIYSWRGANIQNILRFEKDFPGAKVITLEQNYRSSNNILRAANALIKENVSRYEKNLWSDKGDGEKISLYIGRSEIDEAAFVVKKLEEITQRKKIPLSECAIFYRTNFQSRTFEDALLRENIPYLIIGGMSYYQRKEVKDILSLLRMVIGSGDMLAFIRTINTPRRGFGEVALTKLKELSASSGLDIFTLCTKILAKEVDAKLSTKQLDGLRDYVSIIYSLKEMTASKKPLSEIIGAAIDKSRYLDYLREDPDTYPERKGNIEELVSKAAEWEMEAHHPDLITFLEELTLKSAAVIDRENEDTLRLMTLHNGKGLEFRLVFLVGMEEDLLPHINVKESDESIEEERRLCYVGITRAKEILFLTAARQRMLWGTQRSMRPSRFLNEIPSEYIQVLDRSTYTKEAYAEESTDDALPPGTAVFHKDFGAGIIQKGYNTSLGLTYDVFFPKSHTTRTLVAKYAKLARLGD